MPRALIITEARGIPLRTSSDFTKVISCLLGHLSRAFGPISLKMSTGHLSGHSMPRGVDIVMICHR